MTYKNESEKFQKQRGLSQLSPYNQQLSFFKANFESQFKANLTQCKANSKPIRTQFNYFASEAHEPTPMAVNWRGRVTSPAHRAIIGLDWKGKSKKWLLSGFERKP